MGMESRFLSGASSSLGRSNSGSRDGRRDEASSDIRMGDEPRSPDRCLPGPRSACHRALPRSAAVVKTRLRAANSKSDRGEPGDRLRIEGTAVGPPRSERRSAIPRATSRSRYGARARCRRAWALRWEDGTRRKDGGHPMRPRADQRLPSPSRHAASIGHHRTRLRAPVDARPEGHAVRLPRTAGYPGLLPRGLEPGVLGSARAVSGRVPGVPQAQRRAARDLGRQRLEPPGVRQRPEPSLPPVVRLRAEGRGLPRVPRSIPAEEGTSARALFVLDADGVIWWSYLSPVGVNPGADGILRALEEIDGRQTP